MAVGALLPGLLVGAPGSAGQEAGGDGLATENPVVVGTKPFAESYLLGELFATLLESRGIAVDRRPGLGSTEIVFAALRQGEVDVYPEYTGTGLLVILGQEAGGGDAGQVWRRVAREFRERYDLRWVAPLGFENSYALAVRRATADSLGLSTLSDLAEVAPQLVAGLSPDFMGRPDGLPGLREAYGMSFADTRPLLQAVKYRALASGDVDLIDGYATDGALDRWKLVVLDDDRNFFPPYQAAPLVGGALVRERPEVVAALSELAGRLDEATMRRLNRRVEVDGETPGRVAADALADLGLLDPEPAAAEQEATEPGGLLGYLWARRDRTAVLTLRHLQLVGLSLAAALLVAVPLGLGLERARSGAEAVIRGVGLLQTLPSIALLAFMIPLLGIGVLPAVTALFLYSLFPIVRNTYSGVRDADPTAVAAARALGMTEGQILLRVRLPLAAPILLAGVRTAAVINVGTATLAAFIGAGGLGDPIVAGLALSDTPLILSGALPAAVLALVVDLVLQQVERWVTPRGLTR
jgi:osmoprotectant transport system permease protein